MCITPNSEEAKCFEALSILTGDRDKAWRLMVELNIDGSVSLPFYGNALYAAIGKTIDEISLAYKEVDDAFSEIRADYSIITSVDRLFPENKSDEKVCYLYAAGNKELLAKTMVACVGAPSPSIQGRSDMANAVSTLVASDIAILAPLDSGLGAFALSVALKENGSAIAVMSSPIARCQNPQLLDLMGELYEKGLLISQFAPNVKSQKWHVVLRNRFLAGISKGVYLAEDKDGGPSWAIFDYAKELGASTMISKALVDNPNCRWPRDRVASGSLIERKPNDLLKLAKKNASQSKSNVFDDLIPDLFS